MGGAVTDNFASLRSCAAWLAVASAMHPDRTLRANWEAGVLLDGTPRETRDYIHRKANRMAALRLTLLLAAVMAATSSSASAPSFAANAMADDTYPFAYTESYW